MESSVAASNDHHAVVVRGSMAGLLAARVLCENFGRVTVVERDTFPEGPEFRKGEDSDARTNLAGTTMKPSTGGKESDDARDITR